MNPKIEIKLDFYDTEVRKLADEAVKNLEEYYNTPSKWEKKYKQEETIWVNLYGVFEPDRDKPMPLCFVVSREKPTLFGFWAKFKRVME